MSLDSTIHSHPGHVYGGGPAPTKAGHAANRCYALAIQRHIDLLNAVLMRVVWAGLLQNGQKNSCELNGREAGRGNSGDSVDTSRGKQRGRGFGWGVYGSGGGWGW